MAKIHITDRSIDEDGRVIHTAESLFQSLFYNPSIIEQASAESGDEIDEYNKWANILDVPPINQGLETVDHDSNQESWFIPKKYLDLDVQDYLLNLCSNDDQKIRICEELIEYESRNLLNLLRFMIYIVDIMRENNVVWGVGRGSSVSSYVLYKIGVHKIDSLKYALDIKEFLK